MTVAAGSRSKLAVWCVVNAIYLVLLFTAGGIPNPRVPIPSGWFSPDKILHAIAFAVLVVIALPVFSHWSRTVDWTSERRVVAAIVFSAAVGGALEGYQAILGYRSAEFLDFVADAVGAVFAGLVAAVILRCRGRHRSVRLPG